MRTAPRPRPKRVTFAAFLALGVMLAAVSISVGSVPEGGRLPEAGAQTAKAVTVTPAAAMAGETVTVRWSGFTPGAPVSIFQCATAPLDTWKSSCAEPTWTGGVTGLDGTGSAEFLVWQYTLPGLGSNPALFCGETGCGVVVTECDTELTPGLFAAADLGVPYGGTNPVGGDDEELEGAALAEPVATAPAAAAAAETSATQAATTEAAAAAPQVGAAADARSIRVQAGQAMDPVLPELADALIAEGVSLDSTVLNSPASIDAYIAGKTDIALTGRPLSASQQAKLTQDGKPTVMVPIAVSPQVIIHNMDVRGVPIQRFRMSVDTVAKVYRGLIAGVESPDLRRDNGGCGITTSGRTTDRSILGFFRTGRSAANYTFSKWLTTAGKDEAGKALWPPLVGNGVRAEAPSELIPNSDTGKSKNSNHELAEFIRTGPIPGTSGIVGTYTNDQGRLRIGFVDMSAAVELIEEAPAPTKPGLYPIRGVEISNASGNWTVPTPGAVNATLAESTIREDHSVDINVRATAPDAYPLVTVIYALVPAAPVGAYDAEKATTGKDLIEFLLSDEGQSILEEAGFVRLAGKLDRTALGTLSEISTVAPPATTTTTTPPAPQEYVLDSSGMSGGDYSGGGFDQLGGDGSTSDDGFAEEAGAADGDGEEATGDATIETSASLLERAAGAPALLAVLLLGAVALTVGQVLKRADRRRRASGAA